MTTIPLGIFSCSLINIPSPPNLFHHQNPRFFNPSNILSPYITNTNICNMYSFLGSLLVREPSITTTWFYNAHAIKCGWRPATAHKHCVRIMSLLLVLVLELMWLCVGVYTQSPGEGIFRMEESSSTMICLYSVSSSPHIYCCCWW